MGDRHLLLQGDSIIIQMPGHNCKYKHFGGAGGIQTPGLRNANAALYQLSYSPMNLDIITNLAAARTDHHRHTFLKLF